MGFFKIMLLKWLLKEKRIYGDVVDLVLERNVEPEDSSDGARNLIYSIYLHDSKKTIRNL